MDRPYAKPAEKFVHDAVVGKDALHNQRIGNERGDARKENRRAEKRFSH